MSNEWDNETNLSDDERRRLYFAEMYESQRREREERRAARGYFNIDPLTEDDIKENFERWRDVELINHGYGICSWSTNKTWWVCHHCGNIGFKYSDCSELFRCYDCSSRNVSLVKAGDLSKLVRDAEIGVNMEDVYERRRERLRARRRERAIERRNTQREAEVH